MTPVLRLKDGTTERNALPWEDPMNSANENYRRPPIAILIVDFLIGAAFAGAMFLMVAGGGQ